MGGSRGQTIKRRQALFALDNALAGCKGSRHAPPLPADPPHIRRNEHQRDQQRRPNTHHINTWQNRCRSRPGQWLVEKQQGRDPTTCQPDQKCGCARLHDGSRNSHRCQKQQGKRVHQSACQIQQNAKLGKVIGQIPRRLAAGEHVAYRIAQHEPGVQQNRCADGE